MFIRERSLFIRVTLDASCISASRKPCLFCFKTPVCVVAVAATHRTLEYLMVEGLVELVFGFAVALDTELRLSGHEHLLC